MNDLYELIYYNPYANINAILSLIAFTILFHIPNLFSEHISGRLRRRPPRDLNNIYHARAIAMTRFEAQNWTKKPHQHQIDETE